MKTLWVGILVFVTLTLFSCGKKNKDRVSGQVVKYILSDNIVRYFSAGGEAQVLVDSILPTLQDFKVQINSQGYSCPSGTRLDNHFESREISNTTTIGAGEELWPKNIYSGPVIDFFLGMNQSHDLLMVSKLWEMESLSITISLCSDPPLIDRNRGITRLVIPGHGIKISNLTSNNLGAVVLADGLQVVVPDNIPAAYTKANLLRFIPLSNYRVR